MSSSRRRYLLVAGAVLALLVAREATAPALPAALAKDETGGRLASMLLAHSPVVEDLRALCDRIGGRPTGSDACIQAVDWFVDRFQEAGVDRVWTETFTMPRRWDEGRSRARIEKPVGVPLHVVAMPGSMATPAGGLVAPIVILGEGRPVDFERVGTRLRGALGLLSSEVLVTLADLLNDYARLPAAIERAAEAGAAGLLLVGGRRGGVLYRHVASFDWSLAPPVPMAILGREDGLRLERLAEVGEVRLRLDLDVRIGPEFEARNVVAEIRGQDLQDEIIIAGAHVDSWGLGTGALDDGVNCVMLLDVARQMAALGTRPRRTVRFVLFNGEEQGMLGSRAYAHAHRGELDRVAAVAVFDLGTGRITGFSLGGRDDLRGLAQEALRPVDGYGATRHTDDAFVGTDNFDFLLEGVPNMVASQAPSNYMENYHAASDTFDKADLRELKINGAIAAALLWGLAESPERVPRQDRAEVEELLRRTGVEKQMKTLGLYEAWEKGTRGRQDDPDGPGALIAPRPGPSATS